MAGLSQYETNLQIFATLEKIAYEIKNYKDQSYFNTSLSTATLLSMGEMAKLYNLFEYGYMPSFAQGWEIQCPDQLKTDLKAQSINLKLLNDTAHPPKNLHDVFRMTYDLHTGHYITCALAQLSWGIGSEVYTKIVMLCYKTQIDLSSQIPLSTVMWVCFKEDNPNDILYPQWAYVNSAKTALFPLQTLSNLDGVYGSYLLDYTHGHWNLEGTHSTAAYIYKALTDNVSAFKEQNFSPEQIKQIWNNLHLGNPTIDFTAVFKHTLLTGKTVYI